MSERMARKRSRSNMVKAFQAEITCWRLSHDEDMLIRMFCACLSERMKGRDPSSIFKAAEPTDD